MLFALHGLSGGEGHRSGCGDGGLSLRVQSGDHVYLVRREVELVGGFGRLVIGEGGTRRGEVRRVRGLVQLAGGDDLGRELVLIGVQVLRFEVPLRRFLWLNELVLLFGGRSLQAGRRQPLIVSESSGVRLHLAIDLRRSRLATFCLPLS